MTVRIMIHSAQVGFWSVAARILISIECPNSHTANENSILCRNSNRRAQIVRSTCLAWWSAGYPDGGRWANRLPGDRGVDAKNLRGAETERGRESACAHLSLGQAGPERPNLPC